MPTTTRVSAEEDEANNVLVLIRFVVVPVAVFVLSFGLAAYVS